MGSNSETKKTNSDNDRDIDDTELNSGNGVPNNEEEKDDSDRLKNITELTDEEIRNMEFESVDKAIDFYEMYAKCCGFGVRKDDRKLDDNGNIVMRQLVCSKQGTRHPKYLSPSDRCKNPRAMTRTGCRARLRVAYNRESGNWRVSAFESSHNHELTPTECVHMIPNYRRMREVDKALADGLHSHGIKTCHILGFMLSQTGGHASLGFCKKDLYNYIDSQKRARVEGGDAFAALSYLQAKADNDPMFYAKFTTTSNGNMENLFWSDGTSRIDYECFGDVVAFDSTYKKNKYNKPLVIFCGYNHHGGTTIFGCALVSDESKETYEWVLKVFLEAMYGKHPVGVVTDGDKAMRKAIKVVFPNVTHRLCSWHLEQNVCEKVKDPKFLKDFNSLIYANYTPDRFETEWKTLIENHGVSNNEWLNKVYAKKKMWASAYMREIYFSLIIFLGIFSAFGLWHFVYDSNFSFWHF